MNERKDNASEEKLWVHHLVVEAVDEVIDNALNDNERAGNMWTIGYAARDAARYVAEAWSGKPLTRDVLEEIDTIIEDAISKAWV